MEAQIFKDIWFRRIRSSWENHDDWRTDIRKNVLDKDFVKTALFILEDFTLIFVPMDEMRKALLDSSPRNQGSIPFNVNPHSKMIGNKTVQMVVHPPKDKSKSSSIEKALALMDY